MEKVKQLDLLAFCSFIFVLLFTYSRIYFGVDFTDEAFYLALPYRFLLGDRPIVDDYSVAQSAGILLVPFFKVFRYFSPDNTAVFIFFRHLYFLFYLAVTFLTARLMSRKCSFSIGLLLGSAFFLYIPFGIPNLSYNTLGVGFFALGLILASSGFGLSGPWVFGTGVLHALAVIAYPPLLPAAVFSFVPVLYFMKERRVKTLFVLIIAALLTGLTFYLLLGANLEEYFFTMSQVLKDAPSSGHELGMGKLAEIISQVWIYRPNLGWVALFLILFYLLKARSRHVPLVAAVCYTAIIFFSTRASQGGGGSSHFVFYYVLMIPLLSPFIKLDSLTFKFFLAVYLPCLAAGICMSIASNNGMNSAANIFILALCIIQFLIYIALETFYKKTALNLLFVLLNCAIFLHFQTTSIFQEDRFKELTHTVTDGPYKYLRTTEAKANYYNELRKVLLDLNLKSGKISFFPHFPTGYLMTDLRAGNFNLFGSCDPFLIENCREQKTSDVVVRVAKLFYTKERIVEYPGVAIENIDGYKTKYSSPNFQVYLKE